MRKWTWSEIKTKVERDLDLEGETFISEDELLGYANEAIDEAEANIHTLYEDYFLAFENLALTSGTSEYDLPSDIYANKIRRLVYDNGSKTYDIRRIKNLSETPFFDNVVYYKYLIVNNSSGTKIKLYPASDETSSSNVTIWYIRNATRLTSSTSECDIPEFTNFVMQYIKVRCYEKEKGTPPIVMQKAIADLNAQRNLMVSTLTDMVDDRDTEIEQDLSFYEFSS